MATELKAIVPYPHRRAMLAFFVHKRKDRIPFVGIASIIPFHAAAPPYFYFDATILRHLVLQRFHIINDNLILYTALI